MNKSYLSDEELFAGMAAAEGPMRNGPGDEATVIHLVEALLTGRPHYAANLLSFFGRNGAANTVYRCGTDASSFDFDTLYREARMPPCLRRLFEVAVDVGLEIYEGDPYPFDDETTRVAVDRYFATLVSHEFAVVGYGHFSACKYVAQSHKPDCTPHKRRGRPESLLTSVRT